MSISSAAPVSWEDQVVPALRKRLENESAYLSRRISSNGYTASTSIPSSSSSFAISEHTSGFGSGHASHSRPFPGSRYVDNPNDQHDSNRPNERDVLIDGHDGIANADPLSGPGNTAMVSRIPVPIHSSSSTRPRTKSTPFTLSPPKLSQTTVPTPELYTYSNKASVSPSTTKQEESRPRTLNRPRSKSQLTSSSSTRPSFLHPSTSDLPPPPLPSGIPRATRRGSTSPVKRQIAPNVDIAEEDGKRSRPSISRHASSHEVYGRSESPELPKEVGMEGLVKNELPPFQLYQEDMMKIAERGYDLDGPDDMMGQGRVGDGWKERDSLSRSLGADEGVRKRTVTMRNESLADRQVSSNDRSSTAREQGEGIGLGQPSSSSRKTAQNRSATSRTTQSTPLSSDSNFVPRSASLNLLSSTSSAHTPPSATRSLGVAAHFVPPESTYKPPKGANWDEVVLPTVAKKLGINDGSPVRRQEEEGDLAVEWDKEGTPVKWVKRVMTGSQSVNTGLTNGSMNSKPSTSFSKSFEPSPENPLVKSSLDVPQPSGIASRDASVRQRPSNENMGQPLPSPLRTPLGPPTDIPEHTSPSISRRPSALRKVSQKFSQSSLKSSLRGEAGRPKHDRQVSSHSMRLHGRHPSYDPTHPGWSDDRPAGPATNHFDTPHHVKGPVTGNSGNSNMTSPAMASKPGNTGIGSKGKKGHRDEVGKGCGCVVM